MPSHTSKERQHSMTLTTYTPDELTAILAEHTKWFRGEGRSRANLTGANLSGAEAHA